MSVFISRLARGVVLSACTCLFVSTAWAGDPPFSDLAGREPVIHDLVPRPIFGDGEARGAELSVSLTTRDTGVGRDWGGSLALSLPTDRFLSPAPSKAKRAPIDGDAPPASPGEPRAIPRPHDALPLLRPRDARAAISAALERIGLDEADARLDDLDTRARWSALMPRLRLRATRLIDQSTSLSPTSYDAGRTTSSGGASLWLEARATWQLDRLIFADEELPVERLRQKLAERSEAVAGNVLDALFAWQSHVRVLYDPLVDPEACLEQQLLAEQSALRADWLTGGWFSRWRRNHPLPDNSCVERPPPTGDAPIAGD